MVRHRRLGDGKLLAEVLAGGVAPSRDALEDRQPACVGEGFRNPEKFIGSEHDIVGRPVRDV